MRVTIQKIFPEAGSAFDATPFLDESQKQIATQELEFNSFQRTMPDVMLNLSDLGGEISALFDGLRMADVMQVELYDDTGRRRFWGHMDNTSLTFSLRDRYARFTALSGIKRFWDKAKTTKLFFPTSTDFSTTIRLDYLFAYQIAKTNLNDDGSTFLSVDLGAFASETVRGIDEMYYGTFQNLNHDTTWYELLTAISLVHNAEFYIDPQSRALRMVARVSVLNDRRVDLDARLCEDEDIEVAAIDGKRVDYIKSYALYTLPAPTQVYKPNPVILGLSAGTHYYIVFYEVNGIQTMRSKVLAVTLDAPPSNYGGWQIWLNIPAHPQGVGARHVYRSDPSESLYFMAKIAYIAANDATDKIITDFYNTNSLRDSEHSPAISDRVEAWFSFDEETQEWETIVDAPKGMNTPTGNIFDIIPTLHFMNPDNRAVAIDDDPINTYDFFVRTFDPKDETIRLRWADLFRTRRVVRCKVTGIDYEVGDSVVSGAGFFPNDLTADKRLVVRKAVCNLMENTSQLELVTI